MPSPASKTTDPQTPGSPVRKTVATRIGAACHALAFALIAFAAWQQPVRAEETPQPQVQAAMLDGSPYSLADSRGSIAVLAIWSPDSLASRKCMWELQRFASAYQTRGVTTVAASTLDDVSALRQFVTKRNLSLPVAILGNNNLGPLPEQNMPFVYVFDGDGRLRASRAGMFSLRVLERMVAPLVQQ